MAGTATQRHAAWLGLILLPMATFVVGVYVLVVRGGGALVGQTESPHLGLSVLATAIVALGFEPVLARARRWATKLMPGGGGAPFEVLTSFTGQVTGTYPTEEIPARMARLLAEGTGTAYAQVWLLLDGEVTLAATWPPASDTGDPPDLAEEVRGASGRRVQRVYQSGELVGALLVQEREGQLLAPVEEKLFEALAAQAGLVLQTVRLRAELSRQLAEISSRAAELRASRQRIVATQDEERRRLERDIHDGAQQNLVALAVNLRLAQRLVGRSSDRADKVFADLLAAATDTVETLTDLSLGIYPRTLTEAGLGSAVRAAAATCPVPVTVTIDDPDRQPASVEAALYFCCLEALQNAAKHARASHVEVRIGRQDGAATLLVADDGVGFRVESAPAGSGLTNMHDRIESAGGALTVVSGPGRGTEIRANVPVPMPAGTGSR